MTQVLDTIPTFEAFARKAFLESPMVRDQLWVEHYEGAYPEVFEAFYAKAPSRDGRSALVVDLSKLRRRVADAAPVLAKLIEEVEPAVARALDLAGSPHPSHVLMVGPMSTNAVVAQVAGVATLMHCLEWFNTAEGARVLVAHEDTHAFQEIVLGRDLPDDPASMAFFEGLAIQASRAVVAGCAEEDYFWYGHEGFSDWLPWCQEHRGELLSRFKAALDDSDATDTFFGSGLVDGQWRVGFYLADHLVGGLGRSLPQLVRMGAEEGGGAIRAALASA